MQANIDKILQLHLNEVSAKDLQDLGWMLKTIIQPPPEPRLLSKKAMQKLQRESVPCFHRPKVRHKRKGAIPWVAK